MTLLQNLDLARFDLMSSDCEVVGRNLIVTKRNWDYEKAQAFQEELLERIKLNKEERAYIFCSHPACLTLGRGLQKTKEDEQVLVDFDPAQIADLGIPLHQVKRGGGVTFHHPGQFICYPLLSLEHSKLGIFDLLLQVLRSCKKTLEGLYSLSDLDCERKLLGLWHGPKKIASIGVSSRYNISYHGLALNLKKDALIEKTLAKVYPCGIPGSVYASLDEIMVTEGKDLFMDLKQESLKNLFAVFGH